MKTTSLKVLLVTGLTGLGFMAGAAPIQRSQVPANPAWVIHIDYDGLRPTIIGQFIGEELNKPEAQEKLAAFQSIFSFDLRTQLHALTLYNTGTSERDGILLVHADFDPDKLTAMAKLAKDSQSAMHNNHEIRSWIDENKKKSNGANARVYGAVQGNHIVILGQQEARVAEALDVLDGIAPNLSGNNVFPQLGATGDGSFIQAAARKLDISSSDPSAAIFKLTKTMRLQIGESQRQLTASLRLEGNDEEVAKNIGAIAQGLVALMKLQTNKPAAKIAEALTFKQDGATVVANLSLPADDVVGVLKANSAKKAAEKAEEKTAK